MSPDAEVRGYLDSLLHYFTATVRHTAECGTPHLALRRRPELCDYTGVVSLYGRRNGVLLFTAPRSMLCVMLMYMHQTDLSEAHLRELVGQIAHTLLGDSRRSWRHGFTISVLSAVNDGAAPMVYPPDSRPLVIPIRWRSYQARLVVCRDA
jgi:chemotaxis protein CheX